MCKLQHVFAYIFSCPVMIFMTVS